jgi:hypothetical protein
MEANSGRGGALPAHSDRPTIPTSSDVRPGDVKEWLRVRASPGFLRVSRSATGSPCSRWG